MVINLADFLEPDSKVLHGREQGRTAREQLDLDRYEQAVIVRVPDDICSLNSSFFVGLFGRSIRDLGESEFRKRFIFECDPVILKNVEDGISCALREVFGNGEVL